MTRNNCAPEDFKMSIDRIYSDMEILVSWSTASCLLVNVLGFESEVKSGYCYGIGSSWQAEIKKKGAHLFSLAFTGNKVPICETWSKLPLCRFPSFECRWSFIISTNSVIQALPKLYLLSLLESRISIPETWHLPVVRTEW